MFVGLAVGLDFYFLPGAQNVCALNATGTGPFTSGNPYSCLTSGGNAFPGGGAQGAAINGNIRTNPPFNGVSDQVEGGLAHGPLPLMLSFDYALNANMMLGARAGYELFTIPSGGAFPPIHLEARFTYLIGHDAVSAKLAPMVFAGLGAGEFDAMVPVQVINKNSGIPPANVNAWLTAGPIFAAVGGGARLQLSKKIFATGALKLQPAFGGTAGFMFGIVPELGIQYGF
jgi:hypothetical protein